MVVATDSVAFLVCNKDRDEVLLATQDRAPMMRADNPQGTILEVGAGRFDTRIGVRGLVVKELKEELGVTATEDEVHVLNDGIPLALAPGVLTERQYLACVEVTTDRIAPAKRLYGERRGWTAGSEAHSPAPQGEEGWLKNEAAMHSVTEWES